MSVPSWTITDRERERFAAYSGDHNPIHTDPVAARRAMGGRMLVHGAHLLLVVLDQAADRLTAVPESIDVTFRRGVRPDERLTTVFDDDGTHVRANVSAAGERAADVVVTRGRALPVMAPLRPTPTEAPRHHTLATLATERGEFELTGDERLATELFPDAVALLGSQRVAELAALSRVVGMRAPGLRSMSSRYVIRFEQPRTIPHASATVRYVVRDVDPRVRRVSLDVEAPGQHAQITAFALPEPVEQRDHIDASQVSPSEFDGRRVLVVGGSRGLGAAAVRLLSAGGADVWFTYRVGIDEARQVSTDTGARSSQFDAATCSTVPPTDGWQPTHVVWCAAPAVDDETAGVVQVDSFVTCVGAIGAPALRGVLWPSCVRPGPVQLAGEQRCAALAESMPSVAVRAPRLPLLATDRTLALLPTEYADTTAVVLAELRALCA